MMRLVILSTAALLSPSMTIFAQSSDSVLENYVQLALSQNPSLMAAVTRVEASDQIARQAGVLPDPMLGVGVSRSPANRAFAGSEVMTETMLSVTQMLPFPGKLGLEKGMAGSDRDMQQAMAKGERAELIRMVKETYYNWAFVRASIRVVETNRTLMNQMVDITMSNYKVGNGLQQDVLRAQSELTMFDDRLLELHQMEVTLKARLNSLLNREPDAELEPPMELSYLSMTINADSLRAAIAERNPDLEALKAQGRGKDYEAKMARREYYPDVTLGVSYTFVDDPMGMTPGDVVGVDLMIPLPIHWKSRQDRAVQQRQVERREVGEKLQNMSRDLEYRLTDLMGQERRLRDQIRLYQESVIPLAQQTFESVLAGYRVSKVDFMTLLSSLMVLFDHQLDLQEKTLDYDMVWSQIESLTGQRIL